MALPSNCQRVKPCLVGESERLLDYLSKVGDKRIEASPSDDRLDKLEEGSKKESKKSYYGLSERANHIHNLEGYAFGFRRYFRLFPKTDLDDQVPFDTVSEDDASFFVWFLSQHKNAKAVSFFGHIPDSSSEIIANYLGQDERVRSFRFIGNGIYEQASQGEDDEPIGRVGEGEEDFTAMQCLHNSLINRGRDSAIDILEFIQLDLRRNVREREFVISLLSNGPKIQFALRFFLCYPNFDEFSQLAVAVQCQSKLATFEFLTYEDSEELTNENVALLLEALEKGCPELVSLHLCECPVEGTAVKALAKMLKKKDCRLDEISFAGYTKDTRPTIHGHILSHFRYSREDRDVMVEALHVNQSLTDVDILAEHDPDSQCIEIHQMMTETQRRNKLLEMAGSMEKEELMKKLNWMISVTKTVSEPYEGTLINWLIRRALLEQDLFFAHVVNVVHQLQKKRELTDASPDHGAGEGGDSMNCDERPNKRPILEQTSTSPDEVPDNGPIC